MLVLMSMAMIIRSEIPSLLDRETRAEARPCMAVLTLEKWRSSENEHRAGSAS